MVQRGKRRSAEKSDRLANSKELELRRMIDSDLRKEYDAKAANIQSTTVSRKRLSDVLNTDVSDRKFVLLKRKLALENDKHNRKQKLEHDRHDDAASDIENEMTALIDTELEDL